MADGDAGISDDVVGAVAPLRVVIERLVAAGSPLVTTPPSVTSRAMGEISEQHRFQSESWPDPVDTAFAGVSLRLVAAADALTAFSQMFVADPLPIYAHMPLLRVSIEACAVAYWLGAPVGVEERVKRSESLLLKNGKDLKRFPWESAKAKGREIVERVSAGAEPLGWEVLRGDYPQVDGVEVPSPKNLIADLFETAIGDEELAGLMWAYLSGVTHAQQWALSQAMDLDQATTSPFEPNQVPLMVRSDSIITFGLVGIVCYQEATARYLDLVGHGSDEWATATDELNDFSSRHSQHATATSAEDTP